MRDIRSYWVTIALVALLLIGLIIICSGCSANTSSTTQSIVEEVQHAKEFIYDGDYFLFRTRSVHEYFKFLEEFDDAKYEIIDIPFSESFISFGD